MTRNSIYIFIFMIFSFSSKGQTVSSKSYQLLLNGLLAHSVTEISVEDVQKIEEEILFIDSREKREYEVSHIQNAMWVGYEELNLDSLESVNKNTKIIVYCSVGYRSEKVAEKLIEKGFTDVSNLYGGIFEWKNQGLQLVSENEQPTEMIHAYSKSWGIWLTKGKKVYK